MFDERTIAEGRRIRLLITNADTRLTSCSERREDLTRTRQQASFLKVERNRNLTCFIQYPSSMSEDFKPEEGASLASKERLSVELVASSLCLSVGKTYFLRDSVRASTTKTSWSQRTIHKRLLSADHRLPHPPSLLSFLFSIHSFFKLQARWSSPSSF